jgi:hypothetical protein
MDRVTISLMCVTNALVALESAPTPTAYVCM